MVWRWCIFFLAGIGLAPAIAQAAGSGIAYHGRILNPDDTAVTDSSVQFRMQIVTPDAHQCVMYQEIQTKDLSSSRGVFSIVVNDGSGSPSSFGYSFDKVFANYGTFTLTPANCVSGSGTYTPSQDDGRQFLVAFKTSTMSAWEALPIQNINYAPMAIEAKEVSGYPATSLLRVDDGSGPQSVSALTPTQATNLLDLVNGTSTKYVATTSAGAALPAFSSNPATPAAGDVWYDSTGNVLKYYNGASVQTVGTSAGVSSVGLTMPGIFNVSGSPLTASGTLAVSAAGTSGGIPYFSSSNALASSAVLDANQVMLGGGAGGAPSVVAGSGTSGQVLTSNGSGSAPTWQTAGGVPGGANTQIQFNNSGVFGADSGFTYAGSGAVSITGAAATALSATTTSSTGIAVSGLSNSGYGVVGNSSTGIGGYFNSTSGYALTTGSGNVGIGTLTPDSLLTVNGVIEAGKNASTTGQLLLDNGGTSGASVKLQNISAITSYNFNLPATAGTAGQVLLSGGGGSSPMTWGTLTVGGGGTGLAGGTSGGIPYFASSTTMASSAALTNHALVVGGGTGASPYSLAAGGAGTLLTGQGAAADPSFSLTPTLGVAGSSAGSLSFANSSTSFITSVRASSSTSAAWTFTLPPTAGTSGYILQTDGAGVTSWVAQAGSGTVNSGSTNQLAWYSANGTAVSGLASAASSVLLTNGSSVPAWSAISNDNFTQYARLSGRSGGQSLSGGTAASENLTLDSTAHATKGYVLLNPSGGNVGVGTTSPGSTLDVNGTVTIKNSVELAQSSINASGATTLGAFSGGNIYRVTLTGNSTLTLPSHPGTSNGVMQVTVVVSQDTTGSRTLSFSPPTGSILWSGGATPTVCSTANQRTIYQFIQIQGESVWYAAQVWKECSG